MSTSHALIGEKYAVYKRDETDPLPPGSYFVLRRQDIFASDVLMHYSNSVCNALDVLAKLGFEVPGEVLQQLTNAADKSAELAHQWLEWEKKHIPT